MPLLRRVEWNGKTYGLGAYPSIPDVRDWRLPVRYVTGVGDPGNEGFVHSTPLHNQGPQGSCVGQSIGKIAEIAATYDLAHEAGSDFTAVEPFQLSRSFPYFLGRSAIDSINTDSGCFARDVIKALVKFGIPSEGVCPYDPDHLLTAPTANVWANAQNHKIIEYYGLTTPEEIEVALAGKNAVSYAQVVYSNFVQTTGYAGYFPKPAGRVEGAHQTTIVAWARDRRVTGWTEPGAFLVENSWGPGHGIDNPYTGVAGGHYWIPYEAVRNTRLVWDIWTVHSVPLIK